jgi:hypothetical protein
MRDEAVLRAVERLKTNPFKTTGIKVELEANLYRDDDDDDVLEAVLSRMAAKLGLSVHDNDVHFDDNCDICGEWNDDFAHIHNPFPGIVYARCYNDGSVDTEITFTVSLATPSNVLLLPKMLAAFDEYCRDYGDNYDVEGAGMHMALINTPHCDYPGYGNQDNMNRFRNFRKSMQLLLPALYFLSAHSENTRGLSYREPRIETTDNHHGRDKFSAVNYTHGAVEFRVFDTCYDQPEDILDNVVVIANCMRYWRRGYMPSGLETITPSVSFGCGNGYGLERLYSTVEHIDLLNAGLRKLKPSYYTITELKQQRKFAVSKAGYQQRVDQIRHELEAGYAEYKQRWEWTWQRYEHQAIQDAVEPRYVPDGAPEYEELKEQVRPWLERNLNKLQDVQEFVETRLRDRLPQGNWRLSPEEC